ncbi:MAG: O-antigen ligase family protein [Prosthecochloris sp.]|nr:O-antigen ligase family protein [Prosthecochloris sp.]
MMQTRLNDIGPGERKGDTLLRPSGSELLYRPVPLAGIALATLLLARLLAGTSPAPAVLLVLLPFVAVFVIMVFRLPSLGLFTALFWGFFGIGAIRYMSYYLGTVPKLGLAIDGLLVLTFLAFFLTNYRNADWKPAQNGLTVIVLGWLGYNILQIANPQSHSVIAWFYAVRGVALYLAGYIILAFLVLKQKKHVDIFLMVWLGLSVISVLWGIRQNYIGLDPAEQQWLSTPKHRATHLLFGHLRVFSFYTDAGQFGAAMGHAGISAGILALGKGSMKKRIFFGSMSLLFIFGLFISGTRGALIIPVTGFMVYLVVNRNFRMIALGLAMMAVVYGFFQFTTIGQGNYSIARMRDAIRQGANTPSMQVRLNNQKKLAGYLANKPFGGGVGSAGYWGQRFSPYTLLAQTPTDSWYVRIWAEEGIVGLYLFLAMMLYFFLEGGRRIMNLKDHVLKQKMLAVYSGVFGITVASYGNEIFGQMPTAIINYISMSFVFSASRWDKSENGEDQS